MAIGFADIDPTIKNMSLSVHRCDIIFSIKTQQLRLLAEALNWNQVQFLNGPAAVTRSSSSNVTEQLGRLEER